MAAVVFIDWRVMLPLVKLKIIIVVWLDLRVLVDQLILYFFIFVPIIFNISLVSRLDHEFHILQEAVVHLMHLACLGIMWELHQWHLLVFPVVSSIQV